MLVVTLSSIPPRFSRIGETLHSLLAQTAQIDQIILYIPETYRRFPDWDGTLPDVPDGVEIRRVEADLGPATKVLPASKDFAGQDTQILFCDDDRAYPPKWAATMLAGAERHADCAIAMRGMNADGLVGTTSDRALQPRAQTRPDTWDLEYQIKRAQHWLTRNPKRPERRMFKRDGYIDMFEGCAGVLIRPDYFDDTAFDIAPVAWGVDDVWLSAMLARAGIPIWLIANQMTPRNTDAQAQAPLAEAMIDGAGRHQANCDAVRHVQDQFGVWLG